MFQLQGRYLQNQVQCTSQQKHDDSRRAAVKVQTESMFVFCFFFNLQGIIWPQVIAGFFGNVLNAVSNYVLLYVLDMGVV